MGSPNLLDIFNCFDDGGTLASAGARIQLPGSFHTGAVPPVCRRLSPSRVAHSSGSASERQIGFQTLEGNILFTTISDLQGNHASGSGAGGGGSTEAAVTRTLEGIIRQIPENFNLLDLVSRISERSPYIVVFLQECERMNILISEIRRSLNELKMALAGLLNFLV
eukprot:12228_1